MPRRGRDLETLVAALQRSIHDRPDVVVQSPGFVRDLKTGERREFDVLIRLKVPLHDDLMLGIECRDRSARVGSPAVEAFHTKCEDTGINRAIIVSSSGFSKPAIEKAGARSIECISLVEATATEWGMLRGTIELKPEVARVQVTAYLADHRLDAAQLLIDPDVLFDKQASIRLAGRMFDEVRKQDMGRYVPDATASYKLRFQLDPNQFRARLSTGDIIKVVRLELAAVIVMNVIPHMNVRHYRNAEGKLVATVSSARMTLGKHSGQFLFILKEAGEFTVSWVPDKAILKS